MLTAEQINNLINRLEAAHSRLSAVETKPTPVDLYYPIKRAGIGTGWGYSTTGIIVDDLGLAAEAIKQLRAAMT